MNAILKSVAAATLACLLSTTAMAAEVINFGIISTESQQNLRTNWEPLLKAMSEKTGLEVKPFFASDYAGIIEGMRFGKVQMAWYGNKSAMEAVDRADGEIFAQSVAANGDPGYWSVIIVPKDSPIKTLAEIKGKRIALPEPAAYMTKFCRAELRDKGIFATRQLAKRQLTWLRSMPARRVVACDDPTAVQQVLALVQAFREQRA